MECGETKYTDVRVACEEVYGIAWRRKGFKGPGGGRRWVNLMYNLCRSGLISSQRKSPILGTLENIAKF